MRYSILFILLAASLAAQEPRFTFGVKGGVPLTDALPHNQSDTFIQDTGRWTVGPTVELRLFRGFSAEFDALYRGYRLAGSNEQSLTFTNDGNAVPVFTAYSQKTKAWDFPLLLKYRFNAGSWRPYVVAGASLTHESSDQSITYVCQGIADACSAKNFPLLPGPHPFHYSANFGAPVVGAGVEFKAGSKLRISPELRYSHRGRPGVSAATLLVGFTF